MNYPLNKLRKEALLLQLSATEKEALHAALMEKIRGKGDVAVPTRLGTPSFYTFFNPRYAMSFAAMLFLVLCGGTAFAAKGALPGDPLYTVKTKVNEPIEGALAFSTEAKIKFHGEVAQTRLEEAEVLASQNRLSAETTANLESDIDAHLSQATSLAAAADEKTPGTSASLTNELNSTISAHGQVLAALGVESSSSTTRENSGSLALRARAVGASSGTHLAFASAKMAVPAAAQPQATTMAFSVENQATSNLEVSSSSQDATNTEPPVLDNANRAQSRQEKNAASLGVRASSSLETLTRMASAVRTHVSTDVAAKLDMRLSRIASLIAKGHASQTEQDFDAAVDYFDQALDKSVTLSTFIAANARFDSGILGNLLNNDSDEEGGE